MKYNELDKFFFRTVDSFFKTNLEYAQINVINSDEIFEWTHTVNIVDLEIMFEDLKNDILIEYYIPNSKQKNVIKFLNYLFLNTECLKHLYLFPKDRCGIFREYQFFNR